MIRFATLLLVVLLFGCAAPTRSEYLQGFDEGFKAARDADDAAVMMDSLALHEDIRLVSDRCEKQIACGQPCHEAAFACVNEEHALVMVELERSNK